MLPLKNQDNSNEPPAHGETAQILPRETLYPRIPGQWVDEEDEVDETINLPDQVHVSNTPQEANLSSGPIPNSTARELTPSQPTLESDLITETENQNAPSNVSASPYYSIFPWKTRPPLVRTPSMDDDDDDDKDATSQPATVRMRRRKSLFRTDLEVELERAEKALELYGEDVVYCGSSSDDSGVGGDGRVVFVCDECEAAYYELRLGEDWKEKLGWR